MRDPTEELVWDQLALAAADLLTDERMMQAGVSLPVAGLYPSLHLNLSQRYRRLGDLDRAREHLQHAQDGCGRTRPGMLARITRNSRQDDCIVELLDDNVSGAPPPSGVASAAGKQPGHRGFRPVVAVR